jgi:hypothetical protein
MLVGRVLTDGRMSGRLRYDLSDAISAKLQTMKVGTAENQVPSIEGSGAHYWGVRCPLSGNQVSIIGGSGAQYTGFRCPL